MQLAAPLYIDDAIQNRMDHMNVQPGAWAVAFHLVEQGHIELTTPDSDQPVLVVNVGEMVICLNGSPHQIVQGSYHQSLRVEDVLGGA